MYRSVILVVVMVIIAGCSLYTTKKVPDVKLTSSTEESPLDPEYYDLAIRSGDVKNCEMVTNGELRTRCVNTILIARSKKELDVTYCDHVTGEEKQDCRDNMLLKLAADTKQITLCTEISSYWLRNQCSDEITDSFAVKNLDIQSCDNIHDAGKRDNCRNVILRKMALSQQDPSLCSDITNIFIKKDCEKKAA